MNQQQPKQAGASKDREALRLHELRLSRTSPLPSKRDAYDDLRRLIAERMLTALAISGNGGHGRPQRQELQQLLAAILFEERIVLKRHERLILLDDIVPELFGLGPLELILRNPDVERVEVTSPHELFVVLNGRRQPAAIEFHDEAHLQRILERIPTLVSDSSGPANQQSAYLQDGTAVRLETSPTQGERPRLSIERV